MSRDTSVSGSSIPTFLDLLDILCCPRCPGVSLQVAENAFRCGRCGEVYPLDDGLLLMGLGDEVCPDLVAQEYVEWEKNAEFYLREVQSPLHRLLNSFKVETYGLDREQRQLRVLDFGGGTGYFSQQIPSWGHVPVTLDLSITMLRLGREAYGLPLPLQCASPPLPFQDESFGAVVANGVLHHCKAQRTLPQTIREIHRVLKPGGLFLVYERNGAFLGRQLHRFVMFVKRALEQVRRFSSSSTFNEPDFNDADIQNILDIGFRIEQRRYISTVFTFMGIVVSNLIEYAGLHAAADSLRALLCPFLTPLDKALPYKAVTVEQCVRLVKTLHQKDSGTC